MKKVIFILGLIFLMFEVSIVYGQIPNWEFIPNDGSYLENENFAFLEMHGRVQYSSVNYIKIKANQDYIFITKNMNSNIADIEVFYYDENKQEIELVNLEPNFYYVSFRTIESASYIKINVNFTGGEMEFVGNVEDDLILIEGTSVPLDYMTIVYQGVTHSYQEINTNYAYITKEIGEVFDVTSFKNKLMAYDNTDGEISENIYIAYDYYTPNYNKCGLWEIMFRVSDNMENETEFSLFVYNKDNVAPVIVGPSLIQTTKDTLLTETEILSNFSAYDEIDLDVSDRIIVKESTYFSNYNKVGKWPIFLEVSDSSGNIKTFVCYIEVLDNEAPIFVVDPLTVNINLAVEMPTIDVIINNLKFENQISSNALIEIVYDEYTSSNNKTGNYIVRLLVDNEIKDIKIVVNETTNEESESVIKKVLNAIKNFFVGIFNLFKNLWEKIF